MALGTGQPRASAWRRESRGGLAPGPDGPHLAAPAPPSQPRLSSEAQTRQVLDDDVGLVLLWPWAQGGAHPQPPRPEGSTYFCRVRLRL